MNEMLIASLRRAIEAAPDDVPLRLHLGRLLIEDGQADEAIALAGAVLQLDPGNADARALMTEALTPPQTSAQAESEPKPVEAAPKEPTPPAFVEPSTSSSDPGFDWSAAESQVEDLAEPMFVSEEPGAAVFDIEDSTITLADVGGMTSVKTRLESAFLAPLRNPELRKLYGKSLGGGLLMYGPPGCGKTFLAKAIAGELGAKFISLSISDVLDPYIGNSEKNLHEAFQLARREAPCVLFFDEFDTLGQRRSMSRNTGLRGTINQLLTELDGVGEPNDGVFILAATNQPWDVDPALRRPGRLDRTVLVLPPDEPARVAIFRTHFKNRPVEGIDLGRLAKVTDGFSGADIAYVCEVASERALLDSARTGVARLISMQDVLGALTEIRPSTTAWLDSARNVVLFGDDDGTYTELKAFLKKSKRL